MQKKILKILTLSISISFLTHLPASVLNPQVIDGNPVGKRNVDWIPAFQLVEIKPQSRFRRGDHIIRYYIGALSKDGKFYRPRSDIQVAEIYLSDDISTAQQLTPGTVFVYPERILRYSSSTDGNPAPNFNFGKIVAKLAANDADLTLVHIGSPDQLRIPGEIRRFSQLPRDSRGNPIDWATEKIGFSSSTIGRYGCVLATLAMMLDYLGIRYDGEMDPGVLNERLKQAYASMDVKAFSQGDRLVLDRAVEVGSSGRAKFISLREEANATNNPKAILDRELALGRPVMVTVPSTVSRGSNHYVLVYAKDGEDYLIKDPGYESRNKLSSYNKFTPRGVIIVNDNKTDELKISSKSSTVNDI